MVFRSPPITASFAHHMSSRGRKAAECKLKRELVSRARAELDFALREAGPARTKPSFADFVQREAELGNTDALRVPDQLAARVSETQRRRCAVMALAVHSPSVEAKDWQSQGEYLEDVLADLAERQGLVPGWAKAVIAAASTGDQSASPAVASSSYAVGAPGSLTGAESIAGPMRQQMPSQQEQRPLDLVDSVSRQDPKRPPAIADARRLPPDATLGPSR